MQLTRLSRSSSSPRASLASLRDSRASPEATRRRCMRYMLTTPMMFCPAST
jgi:hypothetical protein